MLDAIDAIMRHTTTGRAVFDDEVTGAAVMRWVEIIGEAAGRVSPELRTTYQEIPWVGAISMRNRLVHGYFEIDCLDDHGTGRSRHWAITALGDHVKEVRLSSRLTTSPACIVGDTHDLSPTLEKMYRAMGQELPQIKRILELNP